jgi:hypothetical protein
MSFPGLPPMNISESVMLVVPLQKTNPQQELAEEAFDIPRHRAYGPAYRLAGTVF